MQFIRRMTTFERIGKAAATRDNEVLGLTEMVYRAAEGEEVEKLATVVEKRASSWWRRWLIIVPLFLTLATVVFRLGTADMGPRLYVDLINSLPDEYHFLSSEIDLREVDLNLSEEALNYAGKSIDLELLKGGVNVSWIEKAGVELLRLNPNHLGAYMVYFTSKEVITLEDVEAAEQYDPGNDFYRIYWLQSRVERVKSKDSEDLITIWSEWNALVNRSVPIVTKSHIDDFWMGEYKSHGDQKSLLSARASIKQIRRHGFRLFRGSAFFNPWRSHENLNDIQKKEMHHLMFYFLKKGWGMRNVRSGFTAFGSSTDLLADFNSSYAGFEWLVKYGDLANYSDEFARVTLEHFKKEMSMPTTNDQGILSSDIDFQKAFPAFFEESFLWYDIYKIHTDSLLVDYPANEVEEDILPLRHAELAQEVKWGLPFLSVGAVLILACLWGWRVIHKVSLRVVSESLLKLLMFRDVCWVVLLAFVVPLATYFIVLSFTPLGGMQFSLGWSYESRWIQLLAVIVFALVGFVCSLRWRLSQAASVIKFTRMRPWEWTFYVLAGLGLPLIGVTYSLDDVTKEILLLLSAPSLLALFWVCWPTSHKNPDAGALYSLAMRKGVLLFFGCSAFLMAGPLWTYASLREAYWVKKDEYLKPHQNPFGVNKLEHKVREQLAKQLF